VLEQVLDERFAVIAEQVDALSSELPGALSIEELEQLQQQVKDLAERLSAAEHTTIDDFSPMEKAQYFIPWMTQLSKADFEKVALQTGHDPHTVEVSDPAVVSVLEKTFKKQAEEAKAAGEEPKIIHGKTDKPGYKFLEYLNLSVKE